MSHWNLVAVIAILILASSSGIGYLEYSSFHYDSKANTSQLNSLVRDSVMGTVRGEIVNVTSGSEDVNISSILDHLMLRFYELENNSSFLGYYSNYSGHFSFASSFDFNASHFNSTDQYGLALDSIYFVFSDIYTYPAQTQGNVVVGPAHYGSITYSINVGTYEINGPVLTITVATAESGSQSS